MKVWSDGKIIDNKAAIDSFNYTLHYASPAAWEGIRSYLQVDKSTKIFKLSEHIARFHDTATIEGFKIPYSHKELMEACEKIVEANGGGDLYLRPIAYSRTDAESIREQAGKISVDIYAIPAKSNLGKVVDVAISGIVRGYPQFQMQAKTSGNYKCIQAIRDDLKTRKDIDDLLVIDNNGYIVEATVANLFVVTWDGKVLTPPNNGSILPGITRQWVINHWGDRDRFISYTFEEKQITKADLYTASCVFLTGTYSELVLVRSVDGRLVNNSLALFDYLVDSFQRDTRNIR